MLSYVNAPKIKLMVDNCFQDFMPFNFVATLINIEILIPKNSLKADKPKLSKILLIN